MPPRKKRPPLLPGVPRHTNHYGYSCALVKWSQEEPQIKCRLVLHRVPPHVDAEIRGRLPEELVWPTMYHEEAHAMIEAVVAGDAANLTSLKADRPEFVYGFEEYLNWLELRATGGKEGGIEGGLVRMPVEPDSREMANAWVLDNAPGVRVQLDILYFEGRDPWGEIVVERGDVLLSRARVDLATWKCYLVEHHPGRYRGFGLEQTLICGVTGLRPDQLSYRRFSGSLITEDGLPVEESS
jgi:hypothetical protein